jgi:hypothetical protein
MTSVLWDLARRARQATSDRELGFLLVNDSLALVPFRQAALWLEDEGVWTLSGVVQVDANVPYVQWLDLVAKHLHGLGYQVGQAFTAADLPAELSSQWAHWWPEHALWLGSSAPGLGGAGVFLRDMPWTDAERVDLQEWAEAWWHAFAAMHRPKMVRLSAWHQGCSRLLLWQDGLVWWRQRRLQMVIALLAVVLWPVHLTVLSPGELVPAHPTVVRAPLDGVIDVFHVQPNQLIKAEQALFSFDEIVIQSRLDVSLQALATAETDYRQTSQMALTDVKSKTQLGLLVGKVEERRAEIEYLQEQLTRARVLAPRDGVVLMDDPSEWIGKPVATGERILRIAALDDVEIEAWVSLADAISLSPGDSVTLYLGASPLSPVSAKLRYMSHEAVQRPDGSFAYRVRAALTSQTRHRVGLKGTAKLQGGWVPLSYWVLRRPWATVRAYLGW